MAGFQELDAGDPADIAGYRLRARIGSGGMGSVYLSYTRGGQPVALKIVRPEFAEDPAFRRRFEQEVRAARRVQGAYTVPVLDSNTEGTAPWLASAYVPGPSLTEAVQTNGPLPLSSVLLLTAGVAEALQSVHAAGVIHRDLKPSNVLLAVDGPRVIDFGIARAVDTTSLTGTGARIGTPAYMSPEQATGTSATPATDIFSLGLLVAYAASADHPFGEGQPPAMLYRIVNQDPDLTRVPERLRLLVGRCLAKEPADRPSPAEVIEDCRELSDGTSLQRDEGWLPPPVAAQVAEHTRQEPPPLPPPPPPPPPGPPTVPVAPEPQRPGGKGRKARLALVAVLVAAAVGLGAAVAAQFTGDGDSDGDGGSSDEAGPGTEGPAVDQTDAPDQPDPDEPADDAADDTAQPSRPVTPSESESRPPYQQVESGVRLVLQAPSYRSGYRCNSSSMTRVDLDALKVDTAGSDDFATTLSYCAANTASAGIRLGSGSVYGVSDEKSPTPEQCLAAAHSGSLPNPISISDVQEDKVLTKGMSVCVETKNQALVLLQITDVKKLPDNGNLRSYTTSATQWKPAHLAEEDPE